MNLQTTNQDSDKPGQRRKIKQDVTKRSRGEGHTLAGAAGEGLPEEVTFELRPE